MNKTLKTNWVKPLYPIDENGKKYLIKIPQWWIVKCRKYYEAMKESNS